MRYRLIMSKKRRSYSIRLIVNKRIINEVIIDPHYEVNHSYMTDELIYELVKNLNNQRFIPKDRKKPWYYFEADVEHDGKNYRLVWCLEDNQGYLGVINCYKKKRHDKK